MAPPARKLVVVTGSTASGKTQLAMQLAQHWQAPIFNADSRQLYRQLDIGTAKPSAEQRQLVPHELLDVLDPTEDSTAGQYRDKALLAFERWPNAEYILLVGGTGFYIDALLGLSTAPRAPEALRLQLADEVAHKGLAALLAELQQRDPSTWLRIDRQNPVRVLRALEVCRATGQPFSSFQGTASPPEGFQLHWLGLSPPRAELENRIVQRTRELWNQGWPDETAALLAQGIPADAPGFSAIGYREVMAYLRGEMSADQAHQAIVLATRQYAKRQRSYFRRNSQIVLYDNTDTALHQTLALLGS